MAGNKAEGGGSTQKMPRHDSHASATESSHEGSSGRKYNSGAKAGSGGRKADPDGPAPAAKRTTYTSGNGD